MAWRCAIGFSVQRMRRIHHSEQRVACKWSIWTKIFSRRSHIFCIQMCLRCVARVLAFPFPNNEYASRAFVLSGHAFVPSIHIHLSRLCVRINSNICVSWQRSEHETVEHAITLVILDEIWIFGVIFICVDENNALRYYSFDIDHFLLSVRAKLNTSLGKLYKLWLLRRIGRDCKVKANDQIISNILIIQENEFYLWSTEYPSEKRRDDFQSNMFYEKKGEPGTTW